MSPIYSQIFGHDKVSIVDGGLPKWKASGYPMAMGPQEQVPTLKYMANFNPVLLRTLDQVKEAIDAKTAQVRKNPSRTNMADYVFFLEFPKQYKGMWGRRPVELCPLYATWCNLSIG